MPSRHKQLDLLLRYSRDALVLVDAAGNILDVNGRALEVLGLSPEIAEVILFDLFSLETRELFKQALEARTTAVAASPIQGEMKDGRTVDLWVEPFSDDQKSPKRSALVTVRPRDALEKNRAPERFLMLESVGTLAGAVTLDLNNLLGAILGHASFVKNRMDPRSPYFEDVAAIESATISSARLVDQLCSFVQPANEPRIPIDINAAVKNLAAVLKGAFGRRITIALELASDLPPIIADEVLVDRTLIALLVNAFKALPQGGTISVRTGSINRDKAAALGLQDADGGGVSLSVQDTGIGIPADLKDHLFEPFLSAGMDRTTAGLGLTVVKDIVARLKGTIQVESQVGRGSVFTLYFPAAGSVAESDDTDDTLPRGKERILVVDNEPMICTMARRLLEAGGYEVVTIQDGAEALELYRNRSTEIDLVIIDLAMEPLSGREIAAEIFILNPEARVIVSSGFSTFDGTDLTGIDRVTGFIRKPYPMKQLLQMVRDVLDGKEVTPA